MLSKLAFNITEILLSFMNGLPLCLPFQRCPYLLIGTVLTAFLLSGCMPNSAVDRGTAYPIRALSGSQSTPTVNAVQPAPLSTTSRASNTATENTATLAARVSSSRAVTTPATTSPVASVSNSTSSNTASRSSENTSLSAQLFRGNDRIINTPSARPAFQFFGESVSLNFEQAPIEQIVHVILGDILNLDYVIEHPLQGDITLRTRAPIPRNELVSILESLLAAKGAILLRDQSGRLFVGPGASMSVLAPGLSGAADRSAGHSNVVIPLQYIGAMEMAEIIAPLAPDSAFIRIDTRRNLLILAGTRQQMDGWLHLINTFDVDFIQGMSVGVFTLQNAPINEVNTALTALLGEFLLSSTPEGSQTPINIIPVERLNSLIVVTSRAHYLDQIKTWITRLDQAPDNFLEPQLFVYPVQNGSASHLASLMNTLFGSGSGGSLSRDSGVSPTATPQRLSSNNSSDNLSNNNSTFGNAGSSSTSGNSGASEFQLNDGARIVADDQSNALLIFARKNQYQKIENALRRLDNAPAQVLIEASIIEVTLNDELRYGLEWFLKENLGGGWRANPLLNLSGESEIGPVTPGFSFSITNPSDIVRWVINAMAEKALVNVISNPSVLVMDNHTASIQVGNQQPVRSSESVSDGGNITSAIEFKDTGVKLSVTPSVNAGDMVNLQIEQSVTDVGQQDSATGQRSFLERNINSRVAIRSGETVVLGGLIRDNTSQTRSGVPFLMDIPILGSAFSNTNNSTNRTELLVMITPRVLRNEQELFDLGQELRARMRGLKLDIN